MEDILFIHEQEIQKAGGDPGIREKQNIQACEHAPKAFFMENISMTFSKWRPATLFV